MAQRRGEQAIYTFVLNHLQTVQNVGLSQPMCDVLTQHIYQHEVQLPALGVVILTPVSNNVIL